MTNTAQMVDERLKTSTFAQINEHAKIHPDLPKLMLGIAAAGVSSEFGDLLTGHMNEKSKLEGRSKTKKAAVVDPTLSGTEEKYPRPNGEFYFPREWAGTGHQDVMVVRKAREGRKGVLAYGMPGCGKTALFEGAFPNELLTLIGTGDTVLDDFVGSWVQTASGQYEWVDGPLVRAMEEGKVFFIDEVGLIDTKVLAAVYPLMDGRDELAIGANPERGTIKAKPGFYIVAATNPNAPGVVLSEALLSRFVIQVQMTTDWDLAIKLGVDSDLVKVASNMDQKREGNKMSWAPQMRELLAFRDLTASFGQRFALSNLVAAAPENDRDTVAELLGRQFVTTVKSARI